MIVSIVIRTLNEERYLEELLTAIKKQDAKDFEIEIVVVDSGSTDSTLDIANKFLANIVHIAKSEFTFGRSLNIGCTAAKGDALVFISGHCVPVDNNWLANLTKPLRENKVAYTYGRQIAGPTTKFSEGQLFNKYFPATSAIPQQGFFCNNANSAIATKAWKENPFDESLTGLEDMALAKLLVAKGEKIGYVAEANVYHHHNESWRQVKRRYEREAIALRGIMPEVHLNFMDFIRYVISSILLDFSMAVQERRFFSLCKQIILFRVMQYWGAYRGNREHRILSRKQKEAYFYPKGI